MAAHILRRYKSVPIARQVTPLCISLHSSQCFSTRSSSFWSLFPPAPGIEQYVNQGFKLELHTETSIPSKWLPSWRGRPWCNFHTIARVDSPFSWVSTVYYLEHLSVVPLATWVFVGSETSQLSPLPPGGPDGGADLGLVELAIPPFNEKQMTCS